MTPLWSISADGEDVTARLADYLIRLSLTDGTGLESDSLDLEIADPLASIAFPRLGTTLAVSLGYAATGAVPMGEFVVDTVEISRPPRQITIRAHAADLREGAKDRQTRAFEGQTLGTIVGTLAGELGLTAAVAQDIADIEVVRIDQTNEGNLSFATRLGQAYGAIATVKAGRLVFARRGAATAVGGTALAEVALAEADLTSWRVSLTEVEKYTAVEARYYDRETATEEWVRSGEGDSTATYRLRSTFPDRNRAQAAADAKLAAQQRGETSCSLTLPGRPDILAETPIVLTGIDAEMDGRWIVIQATHTLDSGGYQLNVDGERELE